MFSVQTGLSGRAAKQQARYLAKQREQMLRAQHRAELARLRGLIANARKRQRDALGRTLQLCRRGRERVRVLVKDLRARERERINREVRELRLAARAQCQARKHRVRESSKSAQERARRELREKVRLQRQLGVIEAQGRKRRAKLSSAKERREESDDEVRSNLPPELHGVWAKVKRTIKAGPRSTRTEAFLEWAEAHAEDVAALQFGDVDREVRELVRLHEKELRRSQVAPVSRSERKALERIGLAKTKGAAKRAARAGGVEDYVPF